jgi:hypothetical protein
VDERRRSTRLLEEADRVAQAVERVLAESDAARRRRLTQAVYIDRQRNRRGASDE